MKIQHFIILLLKLLLRIPTILTRVNHSISFFHNKHHLVQITFSENNEIWQVLHFHFQVSSRQWSVPLQKLNWNANFTFFLGGGECVKVALWNLKSNLMWNFQICKLFKKGGGGQSGTCASLG